VDTKTFLEINLISLIKLHTSYFKPLYIQWKSKS